MSQSGTVAPSTRLRRAIVFFNRRAGGSDRTQAVQALAAELAGRGVRCDVESESAGLAARLVEVGGEDGTSAGLAVIAAGGDGTVGWAASHLPPHVPLGVFPLGTENLLARYLGATADPQLAADQFCQYQWRTWDAMEVNGRLGLLMVSCGLDAEVVHRVHGARRGNISHWTYASPLCLTLSSYRFPTLRVSQWVERPGQAGHSDPTGGSWESVTESRWCFVFNAPVYALGLALGRGAIPFDGQLDILTLKRGGVWSMIGYLSATLWGRLDRASGVDRRQAQRIRIECDQRVAYQLDGDPGGELPVEVVVVPDRLRVLTGRSGGHGIDGLGVTAHGRSGI